MDQSLNYLKEVFHQKDVDLATYSPLTLAYIGDAAYELIVRTYLVDLGNAHPNALHRKASAMVKAQTQAAMIEALLPDLTEEEEAVYKRGRNARSATKAKNATTIEYRKATGFEAVMGYLYLSGNQMRMIDLAHKGLVMTGILEQSEEKD